MELEKILKINLEKISEQIEKIKILKVKRINYTNHFVLNDDDNIKEISLKQIDSEIEQLKKICNLDSDNLEDYLDMFTFHISNIENFKDVKDGKLDIKHKVILSNDLVNDLEKEINSLESIVDKFKSNKEEYEKIVHKKQS